MRYKREESFRYVFGEPKSAQFQIIRIDGEAVESSEGQAKMIDISPEGARLHFDLNIPEVEHKSIQLSITFQLNKKEFTIIGNIIWKKQFVNTFDYGLHFIIDEAEQDVLIEQLKIHSKNELVNS